MDLLQLYCFQADIPDYNVLTEDNFMDGPLNRRFAVSYSETAIRVSFYVDANLAIRKFLEQWSEIMINDRRVVSFFDDYAIEASLSVMDESSNVVAQYVFSGMFPMHISDLSYSWQDSTMQIQSCTFAFEKVRPFFDTYFTETDTSGVLDTAQLKTVSSSLNNVETNSVSTNEDTVIQKYLKDLEANSILFAASCVDNTNSVNEVLSAVNSGNVNSTNTATLNLPASMNSTFGAFGEVISSTNSLVSSILVSGGINPTDVVNGMNSVSSAIAGTKTITANNAGQFGNAFSTVGTQDGTVNGSANPVVAFTSATNAIATAANGINTSVVSVLGTISSIIGNVDTIKNISKGDFRTLTSATVAIGNMSGAINGIVTSVTRLGNGNVIGAVSSAKQSISSAKSIQSSINS